MKRNIVIDQIKNRITNTDNSRVFIITDFLDLASYDAVRKALSRLTQEKTLIRVMRGMYKKPNYNEFIHDEVPASPDAIAKAIARNNNWTIGPRGDAALNILGLTTQVPNVYNYISDGSHKEVDYKGTKIVFTKRSNKDVSGYSYKTILIIEALRTLGSERIDDNIRMRIAQKCTESDYELLNKEGIKSRKWIYEEIKKIMTLGGYNYA